MLEPLPVAFDEELHQYTWTPTGEVMLWSVSGVAAPMSDDQREWLERNRHHADRGSAIHKTLEEFLSGRQVGDLTSYAEWTDPLLHHSWWDEINEVIALEYRLADPARSLGGSFDGLIRRNGRSCLFDLKSKYTEQSKRVKPLAQLGAYASMLEKHHKVLPDEAWVVWSYPGGCDFEQLDLMQCLDRWEGAWLKHEARQEVI